MTWTRYRRNWILCKHLLLLANVLLETTDQGIIIVFFLARGNRRKWSKWLGICYSFTFVQLKKSFIISFSVWNPILYELCSIMTNQKWSGERNGSNIVWTQIYIPMYWIVGTYIWIKNKRKQFQSLFNTWITWWCLWTKLPYEFNHTLLSTMHWCDYKWSIESKINTGNLGERKRNISIVMCLQPCMYGPNTYLNNLIRVELEWVDLFGWTYYLTTRQK